MPKGLRFGFSIGLDNFTLSHTFIPPNQYTLPEHHEFLISKYSKEMQLGRISKGYTPDELEALIGPFRTAPISIATSSAGKLRVVVNHSFPRFKFHSKKSITNTYTSAPLDYKLFLPRDTFDRLAVLSMTLISCVTFD